MSTRIEEVEQWLLQQRGDLPELDLDTDLIDNRVLDSVTFINFAYFMEEFTGKKFPLTSPETATAFRTLRAIQEKILEEVPLCERENSTIR